MTHADFTTEEVLPESVSVKDRNQRLYDTLKGMALYAVAIPRKDRPDVIDYVVVTAVAPGIPLDYLRVTPSCD